MGIIARFILWFRSSANAAIAKAEDPTKMLEQSLADMQIAHGKAKEQVAATSADLRRLQKKQVTEQKEADKWNARALKSVEMGDDDLAREALQRRGEHTRISDQMRHEMEAHTHNVADLKSNLTLLGEKIGEIRRKKNLLVSQQKRAEAQDQIYATLEGVSSEGAMDVITRMEDKIDEMTALSEARMELSDEFSGDQLDKKFKDLDGGAPGVDQELLEMKQRLQLEAKPVEGKPAN